MQIKMIKLIGFLQQRTAAGGNPVLELEKVGIKAAMDLLQSNSTDVTETAITDQLSESSSKNA